MCMRTPHTIQHSSNAQVSNEMELDCLVTYVGKFTVYIKVPCNQTGCILKEHTTWKTCVPGNPNRDAPTEDT